jgi:hypothetical protein
LPFFQISGNVCENNDAVIIFVGLNAIVEAGSFGSFAFIWSSLVALFVLRAAIRQPLGNQSNREDHRVVVVLLD